MIKKTCEYCGEPFWIYPSWTSKRFCSIDCYNKNKTDRRLEDAERRVKSFKSDDKEIIDVIDLPRSQVEVNPDKIKRLDSYRGIPGVSYYLVATI